MHRLGACAASALLAYVAAFAAGACALLAHDAGIEMEGYESKAVRALTYATAFLVIFGCASYIYVGHRAPRPSPLHWHGLVLMMLLAEICIPRLVGTARLGGSGSARLRLPLEAVGSGIWGVRRAIFVVLMVQKISALGCHARGCCLSVRFWGLVTVACTLITAWGVAVPGFLYSLYMIVRGTPEEEALKARTGLLTGEGDVTGVDRAIFGVIFALGTLSVLGVFCGSVAFIVASRRAARSALAELVQREVSEDMLAQVRRLVRRQLLGVLASLGTSCLLILATSVQEADLKGVPLEGRSVAVGVAQAVDSTGDVVGIMLLSGIGVLLLREDPDAGDIGASIRALLHAAVLTSRADSVFEGVVRENTSQTCIVSFPGKFISEWNALTWLCEQGHVSSACVFLPRADPQQRFGKHVPCPDAPGRCWCQYLYGEEKPWGCLWFEVWRFNVQRAVELQLELVVVFFPKQAGRGVVPWEQLGNVDLWDGIGLGGSQKAEVAFLNKMGYSVVYEGLDQAHNRISNRQIETMIHAKPHRRGRKGTNTSGGIETPAQEP